MYSPQDPPQSRYDSPGGVEDDLGLEGPSAVDKAKDMAGGAGSLVKAHWKKASGSDFSTRAENRSFKKIRKKLMK